MGGHSWSLTNFQVGGGDFYVPFLILVLYRSCTVYTFSAFFTSKTHGIRMWLLCNSWRCRNGRGVKGGGAWRIGSKRIPLMADVLSPLIGQINTFWYTYQRSYFSSLAPQQVITLNTGTQFTWSRPGWYLEVYDNSVTSGDGSATSGCSLGRNCSTFPLAFLNVIVLRLSPYHQQCNITITVVVIIMIISFTDCALLNQVVCSKCIFQSVFEIFFLILYFCLYLWNVVGNKFFSCYPHCGATQLPSFRTMKTFLS